MNTPDRSTRILRILTVALVGWAFAQLIVLGFRYFYPSNTPLPANTQVSSGQRVDTMPASYMCQPLKTEVDFADVPVEGKEEIVKEKLGKDGRVEYTTLGGCIDTYMFIQKSGKTEHDLKIIGDHTGRERQEHAFVVALNEQTPYFYVTKIIDRSDEMIMQQPGTCYMPNPDSFKQLFFVGESANARITKHFATHADSTIDLELTVEPLIPGKAVQPRVLFPAPLLEDLQDKNGVSAFIWNARGSLEKLTPDKITGAAWALPQIFGLQNRYFACGLIKDDQNFAKRAYFKHAPNGQLTGILEGPEITTKTTWHLKFYLGPKEWTAFAGVEPRLQSLLEYGWFSWVARGVLFVLNFFNNYIGNYGWAIVLLALLINLLLWPLTIRGEKSKGDINEYTRKLKYVESRYSDDPERLKQEKMELMSKYGAFPGMSGCLPFLFQIPILIGLSSALRNSFELYHAPFIWWIKDMAAHDPYYVLPAILAASIFVSTISTAKTARQIVVMGVVSLAMAGFMMSLPAGLCLFFVVSSLARLGQLQLTKMFKRS